MAVDSSLPVGTTGEVLETVKLADLRHREGMFLGDPTTDAARAVVSKSIPDGSGYGLNAYVLGIVSVSNFPATFAISNFPASQAVTGPLTDAQLRAVAVPVSGGADHVLTFAGDKVDASGSSVTVAASALPAGAATDAAFTAANGTAAIGAPAAGTVLDRLYQLGLKGATEATLKQLLAAMKPVAAAPSIPTLLHRR